MGMEVFHPTGEVRSVGKVGTVNEKAGTPAAPRCDWSCVAARISEDRRALLRIVVERALELGDFTLSSGRVSDYYIDGKQVTLSPDGALLFARIILEALRGQPVDVVGGLSIGADPIVGSVALLSELEARPLRGFIVRQERKSHGKMLDIEGPLKRDDRAVIVDDVITTGASILKTIGEVERHGAKVVGVLALVDREEGRKTVLQEYPTFAIFTTAELKEARRCREPSAT